MGIVKETVILDDLLSKPNDFAEMASRRCGTLFQDIVAENARRARVAAETVTILGVAMAVAYELDRAIDVTKPVETFERVAVIDSLSSFGLCVWGRR